MGLHHANINTVRRRGRDYGLAIIQKAGEEAKVTNWNCQPVETSASVTHRRMEVDEDLVSSTMTTNQMFGEDNQKPRVTLLDGATLRLSLPLLSWTGFCGRRPIITSIGQSIIWSLWQGV